MNPIDLAQAMTGAQLVRGTWPAGPVPVVADSRHALPGCVFVACADDAAAREAHAARAVAAGAVAVVAETPLAHGDTLILVPHAREVYARSSVIAHGLDQGRHPPLLALTGTDGKTTASWCAWHALGPGAARIGTLGFFDGHRASPGANTTPGPDELHPFLAGLDPAMPGVALELSSIGLDQRRLAGLRLHGLVHTGLGHDHLDYHGDRDRYAAAKLLALELVVDDGLVVLDADDVALAEAAALAWARGLDLITLGIAHGDARLRHRREGWQLRLAGRDYRLPVCMPGPFNAWNAAAGALLATAAGIDLATALQRQADLPPVPGRLELLGRDPAMYVDYAHTPLALERVLAALRQAHPGRRLVCVFGCGGDRDRLKRGPMGRAATAADLAVLTTDNSRSEDPEAIAREVLQGLDPATTVSWHGDADADVVVILDRGAAIRLARVRAGRDGVVVVCGKGHETWQEVAGVRHPWDDRAAVRELQAREEMS